MVGAQAWSHPPGGSFEDNYPLNPILGKHSHQPVWDSYPAAQARERMFMQAGADGVTGATWAQRRGSHSIADIVSQNPKPLESKLFQLPELVSTAQLVQSLLPGEKHDPLSPRT